LGGWRNNAPIRALVASNPFSESFAVSDPIENFRDAKLKIQWAKGHIYKLVDQYRAILDADVTRLSVQRDGQTGKQLLNLSDPAELPPMIALIVGDAIHNLRTAFDYIAIAATGIDSMALPVGKTRDDIIAKSKQYRTIKETSPRLADFIIDEIQPYYRGKFMLWELSELDRIDKHRLILPTIYDTHRLGVILEDESGKTFTNQWVTSRGSSVSRVLDGVVPFKIKDGGYSGIGVSFGPGTPFNDKPVLETLSSFLELAPQAVEAFERFCFGDIPNPNAAV
jgi:hypothetical protein